MHLSLGTVVAVLTAVFSLIDVDLAVAAERDKRQLKMSDAQRQFIIKAFAEVVPEAGAPDISSYPEGAYAAKAVRGGVHVYVDRTRAGEVTAQYTSTGPNASRGVSKADRLGNGFSQTLFGPTGDRSAEYAASRLARMLAPPLP
jgi:hypothetical protein